MFQVPSRSIRYLVLALLGLLILLPAITMPDLRWHHVISTPPGPGVRLIYQFTPQPPPAGADLAGQTVSILQRRLDPDGSSGIEIRPVSPDTVEVDVVWPASKRLDQIESAITARGILEFHILASAATDPVAAQLIKAAQTGLDDPATLSIQSRYRWFAFNDPATAHYFKDAATRKGITYGLALLAPDASMIQSQGWHIESAVPQTDLAGKKVVYFTFDDAGTQRFAGLTTRWRPNNGFEHALAVILDNRIIVAPMIADPILGGNVRITGGSEGFTQGQAASLANILATGPLPAPLVFQSKANVAQMSVPESAAEPLTPGLLIAGGVIFLAGMGMFVFKCRSDAMA